MIYINHEDGRQTQVTQHGSRIHVRVCAEETIIGSDNRRTIDLYTITNDELAMLLRVYRRKMQTQ